MSRMRLMFAGGCAALLASGWLAAGTAGAAPEEANIPLDAAAMEQWVTALDAAKLSDEEFAQRTRARWGFRSDAAYVRSLTAELGSNLSAGGANRTYGVPLTDAEGASLERRLTLKAKDRLVVREVLASRPDVAAGYYSDPANDGRLTILTTRPDAALEAAIRGRAEHPERLVFKDAKYTTRQLEDFESRLRAGAAARGVEITGMGVLIPVGRVDVTVAGDAATARATFAELVPDDALLVARGEIRPAVGNPAATAFHAGVTFRDLPPWEGGTTIMSTRAYCQSGFIAQKDEHPGPDSYWLMTAGHCGGAHGQGPGDGIEHEWRTVATNGTFASGYGIGWMRGQCYRTGCGADVAVINMVQTYDTNRIWLNADQGVSITSQQARAGDDTGDQACVSSVRRLPSGGFRCGTINHLSYDHTYGGVTFTYLRRVNFRFIQPGDSGGPVWVNNQALGLVFGYTADSPQGDLYSHIHDAITTAGLRAVKQVP